MIRTTQRLEWFMVHVGHMRAQEIANFLNKKGAVCAFPIPDRMSQIIYAIPGEIEVQGPDFTESSEKGHQS